MGSSACFEYSRNLMFGSDENFVPAKRDTFSVNLTMLTLIATWVVLSCICFIMVVQSQPDGWKMTDRFYGFRYEIFGTEMGQTVLDGVQTKANSMGCFGWVQMGKNHNIVGEARCSKAKGKVFQDWLEHMPGVSRFERLVSMSDMI